VNKIIVVEGFDLVGKDYTIAHNKELASHKFYKPDYSIFDKMLSRNDAWVVGYAIIDYLSKTKDNKDPVCFNRFIATSLVYSEIYGGTLHSIKNLREIYSWYNQESLNKKGFDIEIFHIGHANMESARKLLIESERREITEDFDKFDSFESYWEMYTDAEKLFRKYYDLLGYDNVHYIYNEYKEI
jgi:hypothetical protein